MPGIPRSKGCMACQRRKKKCNEVKPTCGLCTRLGIECVGNGVKRWKFMSYEGASDNTHAVTDKERRRTASAIPGLSITRSPSNEASATAAALVHILEIQDVRYDIRAFGGKLMASLPAQLGTNPGLDSAVSAVVALYNSRQFKLGKVDALTRYGKALKATRVALEQREVSPTMTMQVMLMVYTCQVMVDRKNAERHRIMVAHVFRDTVIRGQAKDIDPGYIHGLCQTAAWASVIDPTFELGDWFWDIQATCSAPRPSYYSPGQTFHSMENDTVAAVAGYLRDPENNIPQLRGIYYLIETEKPRIRQLVALATVAASAPTGLIAARRLQMALLFSWGTILGFEAVINNVLRSFDDDPSLVVEACDCYNEALDVAAQCAPFRPFGAGWFPDTIKAVWAGTSDLMGGIEIENILKDYENDVEGADHLGDAIYIQQRLITIGQRKQRQTKSESPLHDFDVADDSVTDQFHIGNHRCVVL